MEWVSPSWSEQNENYQLTAAPWITLGLWGLPLLPDSGGHINPNERKKCWSLWIRWSRSGFHMPNINSVGGNLCLSSRLLIPKHYILQYLSGWQSLLFWLSWHASKLASLDLSPWCQGYNFCLILVFCFMHNHKQLVHMSEIKTINETPPQI